MTRKRWKGYGAKTIPRGFIIMADPEDRIHVSAEEARAGSTPHMTRYILPISLALVIVIFAVIVFR